MIPALACAVLLQAGDLVGRVAYEKRDTREATYEAMLHALHPSRPTWGAFWQLSPFPYAGHVTGDLATPLAPEGELERYAANGPGPDLTCTYAGKLGATCAWRRLGPRADQPISLLAGDPELDDHSQGYLATTIESPADQVVWYTMGSDDGLRVWLNGELIHDVDLPRSLDPEADRVRFDLVKGTNHVLFKVSNGVAGWDFQVLTGDPIDEQAEAQLFYLLDRDFPPTPERAHYRVMTVPLERGQVLEVGGLAFLGDGRPIACTRRGEVWILDGGYAEPPIAARWSLFAEGLHEPLGLAVRVEDGRDAVYAVQRGEMTRLVDEDGDGVCDRYETASDGWGVSGNYHEFAFGPVFDEQGYAWVTLNVGFCGALGKALVPWRGWALRIAPDGSVEPWADGLRSPNGIGRFRGETFYVDNQGDYVATNRLAHLARGSWHGHPASLRWREGLAPDERPPLQPPAVWFPYKKMGQSAADVAVCEAEGRFGPFDGQVFVGDQTLASVMRVSLEQIEGHWQGACYPFLSQLDCGVNRLAFAPDGSLFVGQTDRGWGSVGRRRHGLQRVVYTGDEPFEIREMRATEDGFELELTDAVDFASLSDPQALTVESYTYAYHAAYGAPEEDTLALEVTGAELVDPRTVRLSVTPLRAGYVHELRAPGLKSAGGRSLLHAEAYYTLVRIPGAPAERAQEAAATRRPPRVLFLTHSAGFVHDVVRRPEPGALSHAEERLVEAARGRFEVVPTQDVGALAPERLADFDAVVFYTTGDLPVSDAHRKGLLDWVRDGGAFVGVHCATDTWTSFPDYVEMIGAAFDGHPWTEGVVLDARADHPAVWRTRDRWAIDDEIYQFRDFAGEPPLTVLVTLGMDSVDASLGKRAVNPIAWCRPYGAGRVFYTALGHRPEVWDDARFQRHLQGGLGWAVGELPWSPRAPADAVALVGGAGLDATWTQKDGRAFAWTRVEGGVEVAPGAGDLVTKGQWGDQRIHVELRVPKSGNSGVYVQGRYEVQVLDSFGRPDAELGTGDCGAIYGVRAPRTNASLAPDAWQSLDVVFRAARITNAEGKTANARASVWLNGILVQDDVEIPGPTPGGLDEHEYHLGPLLLQDHGDRVRYRNVWVLPLEAEFEGR